MFNTEAKETGKAVHCIHCLDMKGWIWRAPCTRIHHHHMSVTITPEPATTCKKRRGQQAKWPSHNAGVRAHFVSGIKLEYGIFVIQFFPDIKGLLLLRAEHIALVSGNLEAVCPVSLFSMTFLETEEQKKIRRELWETRKRGQVEEKAGWECVCSICVCNAFVRLVPGTVW